jgi:DNA-binding CsgD family transcriptional regulator
MAEPNIDIESVKYAQSLGSIAELYMQAENWESAMPIVQEQRRLFEKTFGPIHPSTVLAYSMLAEVCRNQKLVHEALAAEERAYDGRVRLLGEWHLDVADSCLKLMEGHWEIGEKRKAFSYALKAFQILKQNMAPRDPVIMGMVQKIIDMYFSMGENAHAFAARQEFGLGEGDAGTDLPSPMADGVRVRAVFAPHFAQPRPVERVPAEAWKKAALSPHTYSILAYRLTDRQYAAARLAAAGESGEAIAAAIGQSEESAQRTLFNAKARIEFLLASGKITLDGRTVFETEPQSWLEALKNRRCYADMENILSFQELEAARLIAEGMGQEQLAQSIGVSVREAGQIAEAIRRCVNCYLSEGVLAKHLPAKALLKAHRRILRNPLRKSLFKEAAAPCVPQIRALGKKMRNVLPRKPR